MPTNGRTGAKYHLFDLAATVRNNANGRYKHKDKSSNFSDFFAFCLPDNLFLKNELINR